MERIKSRSSDQILDEIKEVSAVYVSLCDEADRPPVSDWELPEEISSLSNTELNDSLYRAALLYAHYARLDCSAQQVLKALKKVQLTLAASLRVNVYVDDPKTQVKDLVLLDMDYGESEGLVRDFEYLVGQVEGERKFWAALRDSFSRSVELRKDMTSANPRASKTSRANLHRHSSLVRSTPHGQ